MNLGQTLRTLREKKEISQLALGKKISRTPAYLSLIENNLREPTLATVRRICKELDVPLPIVFLLSVDETDIPYGRENQWQNIHHLIIKCLKAPPSV